MIARAEEARDLLPKELGALGAIVDVAFAYRTVAETERPDGSALTTGRKGRRYDHFYQLFHGGKLSRARSPLAAGNAGREHRADYFEDRARSRPSDREWKRARHDIPGLVEAIRRFYGQLIKDESWRSEIETDFAAAMQELSANARNADHSRAAELAPVSAAWRAMISAIHSLGQRVEALEESVMRKFRVDAFPEDRGTALGHAGKRDREPETVRFAP